MTENSKYQITGDAIKAAVRSAVTDSLFMPLSFQEWHEIRLKPNFNTAAWTFRPPHYIYIGENLLDKPNLKDGLTTKDLEKYVANHYHHEMGHAFFTDRDFKKLKKLLSEIKIPWPLFNLFEDARIENLYRVKNEYWFNWTRFEELTFDLTGRPECLLLALIQAEANLQDVENILREYDFQKALDSDPIALSLTPEQCDMEAVRTSLLTKLERVHGYYWPKILAAKSSFGLVPLMLEWLDEFGRPPEQPSNGAGEAMDDVALSAELAENDKAFAEFNGDTKEVDTADSKSRSNSSSSSNSESRKKECQPDYQAEAQEGKVLQKKQYSIDQSRAERLAVRMSKIFEDYVRMSSSRSPQRRISARHAVIGRPIYRKKSVLGRARKRVLLIMDTSGSMAGFHSAEGRILLEALSLLARKSYVEGHVVFSGVTNKPCWERYALPLASEVTSRFEGHLGSEGLEFALQGNFALAADADLVLVYTDAQICDRPIDKRALHQRGIFTWGLYAGDHQSYREELERYFDRAILRKSIEEVVDAMLVQI